MDMGGWTLFFFSFHVSNTPSFSILTGIGYKRPVFTCAAASSRLKGAQTQAMEDPKEAIKAIKAIEPQPKREPGLKGRPPPTRVVLASANVE